MHADSMRIMGELLDEHVLRQVFPGTALEVGSFDVNGSYRDFFRGRGARGSLAAWEYEGADIVAGPGVDHVIEPYDWSAVSFGHPGFDLVITGQTIEHVKDVKEWALQFLTVVKPGGLLIIIGPRRIHDHRHPVDCWRILPDGMTWLLEELLGFELLEVRTDGDDTLGVARRPL